MIVTATLLAALALCMAGSFFFSGVEIGTYCLNRVRLRVRNQRGDPAARRLVGLLERPERLVITALIGTNVVDYLATVILVALLVRAGVSHTLTELYATLIGTPLVLMLGGIVPKDIFRRHPDRLMYALSLPIVACQRAAEVTGLVWLFHAIPAWLSRAIDPQGGARPDDALPRARMRAMLHEGAARGGLSAFQRDTIERIMHASQVPVGRVMVPTSRAALVPIDISRDDFLRIARMAHFSRLPVYRGASTNIVGVVSVYDVLTDESARPPIEHAREALFLNVTDTVPIALVRLQQSRQFMAIIRDRRGQTVGLLTMKDLAEEIVGELEVW